MIEMLRFLPATENNIPEIFSLAKDLVDMYEDTSLIDYARVMTWMRRKIEMNISQYVCVKLHETVVAYYRLCTEENGFELDDFYVLPAFRNRGIGTAILTRCLSEANGSLSLCVFTHNTRAIALYKRFGFSVTQQVSPTRIIMSVRA